MVQYIWLFVSQPMNSTRDNIGDMNIREDQKESDNDVWFTFSLCTIMSWKHRRVNTWLDSWCIWRGPSDGVGMLSNAFMVIACERNPRNIHVYGSTWVNEVTGCMQIVGGFSMSQEGKDGFGDGTPPYKLKLPSTPHFLIPTIVI
jgi:hypothetical protein